VRAFRECQNLPKPDYTREMRLPLGDGVDRVGELDEVPGVSPTDLWRELRDHAAPQVIDVREPREFKGGHIPGALSLPLPELLSDLEQVLTSERVVLACWGGRRSARATARLLERGYTNVRVLQGGMRRWEQENLMEAIEWPEGTDRQQEDAR
jgi:SulP family sulfate permease